MCYDCCVTEYRTSLQQILLDKITPETWVNTCQMLLKHSPATMGIQKDVTVTPAEACFYNLYASGIIAERTELESADASNPSAMLTTRYAIAHVLRANKKLCDLRNRKWILCLDEVHHLYQSCFLHDRGPRFLSDLLLEIQRNKVNSVLVSDDSTVCFPYVDEKLAQSISQCYMKTYKDLGYVDTKQLVHLDIPEIETNVAKGGINEVVYHSDSVSKALLKLSGGNLGLINTLLTSYQKFEEQLDLPAVHKILAGSESPVDDEYFPLNATAEEQVTYLREERSRMFVRNIQNVALSSNISKFENMMNRFLSLPLMEQIKPRLEDYVHFKVTVNETIRLLLSKNILQLKPKANIENKVVLCMLAAGIIHLNVETRCIEFKDTLTRVLLEAHIDNDYASLPWIDQVKYKANYLLNQRKIKKEVDRFLLELYHKNIVP
uniref:Uncharacterized protein n=1 Tax=Babesia bovis TaxID=5865 RepID=S6B0P8_BABBO|nr:hypothetical protein [Babesia bovis]